MNSNSRTATDKFSMSANHQILFVFEALQIQLNILQPMCMPKKKLIISDSLYHLNIKVVLHN